MIYLIYVYLNMKSNLLNVSKKRMLYRAEVIPGQFHQDELYDILLAPII